MTPPLVALVLAGGTGTRLYPASRSDRPKQFLSLFGDESLLSQTVSRAGFADRVYVSTRESFADEIPKHAPDAEIIVEPAGKDTGPALAYATHRIREEIGDCVVLVLPSDHLVRGDFESVARKGAKVADGTGALVAFGVEPTRVETAYGYIESGEVRRTGDTENAVEYAELASFREKPDAETAAEYVERGYLWNAGMFAWTPDAFLAAARDSPLEPLVEALDAGEPERGFDEVESISVDYAVMERAERAAVVAADFEWDDVGSWDALERLLEPDEAGNAALGELLSVDASGNVVASDDKHVSLVGVEDLVVVAWDDRVLVLPKDEAQRVREVVSRLKEEGRF
jgi:mannose-1-phosphate guanylyltransferase